MLPSLSSFHCLVLICGSSLFLVRFWVRHLGSSHYFQWCPKGESCWLSSPDRRRLFFQVFVSFHFILFHFILGFGFVSFILASFYGTGRKKDQFDLFAETLGSALPHFTDSDTEGFKSLGGSEQAFSTGSPALQGTEKASEVSKSRDKKLIREEMAGAMRVRPFLGRGDRKENPSD